MSDIFNQGVIEMEPGAGWLFVIGMAFASGVVLGLVYRVAFRRVGFGRRLRDAAESTSMSREGADRGHEHHEA